MSLRDLWLAILPVAAAAAVAAAHGHGRGTHTAPARGRDAILSTEFVFERAPFASAHASTLVETPDGLVAAWFGGTDEGHPDVGIWLSRRGRGGRSPPVEVARCAHRDGTPLPAEPGVLPALARPVAPLLQGGPEPARVVGLVRTSSDDGVRARRPRACRPASSDPSARARRSSSTASSSRAQTRTTAGSRTWSGGRRRTPRRPRPGRTPSAPFNDTSRFEAIQPTILVHSPRELQPLCRIRQRRASRSRGRRTAGEVGPDDGDGPAEPERRNRRRPARRRPVPARLQPHGERPRHARPRRVEGRSRVAPGRRPRERRGGRVLVPGARPARDGRVHATYTWRRKRIRHVVVDPSAIR